MFSLKFLYENPIGALITKHRSRKGEVVRASKCFSSISDPLWESYVRSIPQAQYYRNVLMQGYFVPPSILEGLENFEIRPHDIFIITYPKSGTTWTEEIISLIYNGGDTKKVQKKLLIFRVHHLEVGRPIGHLRFLRKLRSPRLMATHLPLDLIPKQLREAQCKISTSLGNYTGSWDDFLTLFLKGHLVYGSWFDHVLSYWKFHQQHPEKVLFISYEELKMDLERMIERIANFLDRPLHPEAIKNIAHHCSFDQMKNNNMVNREQLPVTDFFNMSHTKFMRKGIIGDWKNYFTPEQNETFEKVCKEKMAGSGLHLVFEPSDAYKRMQAHGRIIDSPNRSCEELDSVSDHNYNELESETKLSDTATSCATHIYAQLPNKDFPETERNTKRSDVLAVNGNEYLENLEFAENMNLYESIRETSNTGFSESVFVSKFSKSQEPKEHNGQCTNDIIDYTDNSIYGQI
ncbi:sulfotransferase family cytosolic 1B member 1-like isoform X2 [Limulus polyphemus]|uniref:Sulfotransferase family cytosolic 1B member 1-like isoform X2 n=1 Tax=Limulus polyphemus TaxID=6850 RepID=A0ABM1SQT9_LIMPO|nr:sulfotransferase family cytosolic 1B member 1-like isoform X2 [Limulus polyphemus]